MWVAVLLLLIHLFIVCLFVFPFFFFFSSLSSFPFYGGELGGSSFIVLTLSLNVLIKRLGIGKRGRFVSNFSQSKSVSDSDNDALSASPEAKEDSEVRTPRGVKLR